MSVAYPTATSANSVLTLRIAGLYDTPQIIQGYAPEEMFLTQAIAITETVVGADGFVAHGFVFNPFPLEISLIPTSPSKKVFDDWVNALNGGREVLPAYCTINYPAVGQIVTLNNGSLTNHPGLIPAQKILGNLKYTITFASSNIIVSQSV